MVVTAPADLDEDQPRDWQRLERQATRLQERIVSREGVVQEQREVAGAQDRLARAEANLRDEERELQRATDRVAEAQAELERVEQRMLAMGGQREPAVALAPDTP
jgi:chromosome segregation ATPase